MQLSPESLLDEAISSRILSDLERRDVSACVDLFKWPWEMVLANENWLREDHSSHRWGGTIEGIVSDGCYLLDPQAIYVGPETRIKPGVVIDAEEGPVWIGRQVTILPHCYVQGPACIGDGSLLQPGTVVHAGTTIGPTCKIGGEIEASIIQGYANKQHDGFLGHSYIGSWVNIAADCVNSDLKNTYGTVRVPINGREVDTGEMFVGMILGDYSKTGINVSFPTGSVVGFCCNVLALRSPKFVPSFSWIDDDSSERFDEERGLVSARKVMARRNRIMTAAQERAFLAVSSQALEIEQESLASMASRFTLELPRHHEAARR
jgi:UDP-N-acetylglucosamine diphosphorylase/glucosamine-1-phosphate N-acetyltransferase